MAAPMIRPASHRASNIYHEEEEDEEEEEDVEEISCNSSAAMHRCVETVLCPGRRQTVTLLRFITLVIIR